MKTYEYQATIDGLVAKEEQHPTKDFSNTRGVIMFGVGNEEELVGP